MKGARETGNVRSSADQKKSRRTGRITAVILLGTTTATIILARVYHLGVASTVVAILLGLPGLWLAWVSYRNDGHETSTGPNLTALADQLAISVDNQWKAEVLTRRLNDPYPLPVSWSAAESDLTDDWNLLTQLARSGVGWPSSPQPGILADGPAELAGAGSDLIKVLAKVPTRRLVILGEPGAGKTMLVVRLVLDMLARRRPGDAVPFLASVASWNPEQQDLHSWLATQMIVDQPALGASIPASAGADNYAKALLARGLILPILDGLDEISPAGLRLAIRQINDALQPGEGVVVTCRTKDYRVAVRPTHDSEVTLRAAAAIALHPLDPETVRQYLLADAQGPAARARWNPVIDALASNAPVAKALTTPLMVSLARIIYNSRPGDSPRDLGDPAELCSPYLVDQTAVESYLFEAFIPTAYRPPGRWSTEYAEKWLTFLAFHLEYTVQGTDLEGYSGARFVTRSLFPIAPCRHNKDDLFMKGFSYHTTSEEQAIACIIPPGSTVKKSSTSASGSILRNVGQ